MTRCDCHACRARDNRRFWRIVDAGYSPHERKTLTRAILFPIPQWDGEPVELLLPRRRNQ